MNIELEWDKPIALRRSNANHQIYTLDLDDMPAAPGVYIFGRRWGKNFEALYIGKATRIRNRVKDHLNSLKLMRHIQHAKTGARVILVGELRAKRGQRASKCIAIAEKALIRYFVAEAHDLVNVHGTRLSAHTITSMGKLPKRGAFFPCEVQLAK